MNGLDVRVVLTSTASSIGDGWRGVYHNYLAINVAIICLVPVITSSSGTVEIQCWPLCYVAHLGCISGVLRVLMTSNYWNSSAVVLVQRLYSTSGSVCFPWFVTGFVVAISSVIVVSMVVPFVIGGLSDHSLSKFHWLFIRLTYEALLANLHDYNWMRHIYVDSA